MAVREGRRRWGQGSEARADWFLCCSVEGRTVSSAGGFAIVFLTRTDSRMRHVLKRTCLPVGKREMQNDASKSLHCTGDLAWEQSDVRAPLPSVCELNGRISGLR